MYRMGLIVSNVVSSNVLEGNARDTLKPTAPKYPANIIVNEYLNTSQAKLYNPETFSHLDLVNNIQ